MIRTIRPRNGESGNVLVEFSVSLVVILTVLFGIIDVGRALYAYDWVSHAARLGTRYAMVRGACELDNGDPCPNCSGGVNSLPCQATGTSSTAGDIQNYVNTTAIGIDTSNVTVTAQCYVTAKAASNPPCATGTWINVKVAYKFSFVSPLFPLTWTMHSTSERTVQN
jgi:Flp pilus assembly protein TadG